MVLSREMMKAQSMCSYNFNILMGSKLNITAGGYLKFAGRSEVNLDVREEFPKSDTRFAIRCIIFIH